VRKATRLILILLLESALAASVLAQVNAHLSGGVTVITGKYKIQFLAIPKIPIPNENVTLNFSIQDLASNNLRNVTAAITITLENSTVFLVAMKVYPYGDFLLRFAFPTEGVYKLILIVFDGGQSFPAYFDVNVSRLDRALSGIYQQLPFLAWVGTLLALGGLLIREFRKRRQFKSRKAL
jgi:hypothetical protein